MFEAEHATAVSGVWELRSSPGDSGDAVLFVGEGTGRNNGYRLIERCPTTRLHGDVPPGLPRGEFALTPDFQTRLPVVRATSGAGQAVYEFTVPRDGSYTLWARCWSMDECGNSCWVGFDDQSAAYFPEGNHGAANYIWDDGSYRRWLWLRLPGVQLRAGRRRMNVDIREDGFRVDQWALLPPGAAHPQGLLEPNTTVLPPEHPWLRADPASQLIRPGRTTAVGVWIRRGQHAAPQGQLQLTLPGGASCEPAPETVAFAQTDALVNRELRIACPAGLPRGEHEIRVRLRPPDAQQEATDLSTELRLSRPFAWQVLAPLTRIRTRHSSRSTFFRWGNTRRSYTTTGGFVPPPPTEWPAADAVVRGPYGTVRWQSSDDREQWFTPYGFLDFPQGLGRSVSSGTARIRTTVQAPAAGTYAVLVWADDQARVWVNGREALTRYSGGPATDEIDVAFVHLNRGPNTIAAAINQYASYWQFRIRIRKPDGSLSGVTGLDPGTDG